MELTDVRKMINNIDGSMKEMFDNRLMCSKEVALVKMQTNDDVYKPEREQEICQRFSAEGSYEYLCFIKKVMQISRKYQYKMFIDNEKADINFINTFYHNLDNIKANGGNFELRLTADETGKNGLGIKDILAVIADTTLELRELSFKDGSVTVKLIVEDYEKDICEACVISYMLYKETVAK